MLETDRLLLRPWRVEEAIVQRQLWEERVPPHRRLDEAGRPTLDQMTAPRRRPRVLAEVGFVASGRVEPDAVHGDSLFLTRSL